MEKKINNSRRNEITWDSFLSHMKKEVQSSLRAAEGPRASGQPPKGIKTTVMRNR